MAVHKKGKLILVRGQSVLRPRLIARISQAADGGCGRIVNEMWTMTGSTVNSQEKQDSRSYIEHTIMRYRHQGLFHSSSIAKSNRGHDDARNFHLHQAAVPDTRAAVEAIPPVTHLVVHLNQVPLDSTTKSGDCKLPAGHVLPLPIWVYQALFSSDFPFWVLQKVARPSLEPMFDITPALRAEVAPEEQPFIDSMVDAFQPVTARIDGVRNEGAAIDPKETGSIGAFHANAPRKPEKGIRGGGALDAHRLPKRSGYPATGWTPNRWATVGVISPSSA
jgi:hypothetical protein